MGSFRKTEVTPLSGPSTSFVEKGTAMKGCATLGANRSEPLHKVNGLRRTTEKVIAYEAADYSVLEERYSPGGRTRTPSILFP
jgi:hypothetical protein